MSGNASRKKHSGDQPEEPGIESVKPAPKMRAKLSKRARAAAIRIGKPKKGIRYKHRPGTISQHALKKDTGLVLEKTPFILTVREITRELHSECKWRAGALEILQKVAEEDLVRHLAMAQSIAHHGKRLNIKMKDMELTKVMRGLFAAQRELFSNWKV